MTVPPVSPQPSLPTPPPVSVPLPVSISASTTVPGPVPALPSALAPGSPADHQPTTAGRPVSDVALVTALAGVAFAGFLLLRPWGDTSGDPSAALAAFASPRWPLAHLLGAAALVLLVLRSAALHAAAVHGTARHGTAGHGTAGHTAAAQDATRRGADRPSHGIGGLPAHLVLTAAGAFGAVLYFGLEAFALHAVAAANAGADPASALARIEAIRNEPLALTLFAAGLLVLALGVGLSLRRAAVAASDVRARRRVAVSHAVLTVFVAGILPHFFLPPAGRVAFGVALLAACLVHALALRSAVRAGDAGPVA
jgi:hypothetical protein